MTTRLAPVVLLLAAGLVEAQPPTPPGKRKIYEVGKDGLVIAGKLTKDDPPLVNAPVAELNGAPHQVLQVKLQKGQSYVIDLASKDFDAYLILQNALGTLRAHDDDSGGELNSRIVYEAPADGVYRVLAAALDKEPGVFQLTIRVGALSEQQKLAAEGKKLNEIAIQLYQQGRSPEAVVQARAVVEIYRKLYPASAYPSGHHDLATSINNLGAFLQATGAYEQALDHYTQSLTMRRKLFPESKYPDGHANLDASLNNIAAVLLEMGQAERALPFHEQSLAMVRKLYPPAKYPDGHPDLALSLNNLGAALKALGEAEKALPYYEQSLAMARKLFPESKYPDGHPDIAMTLNSFGYVLEAVGLVEKALPYYEQALSMRQMLYPAAQYVDGHPDLAVSLSNLGTVLQALGQAEKALAHYEQCLAIRRKLFPESTYPDGHHDLARGFGNMGALLMSMGSYEQARPHLEQALAMHQKLGRRALATASESEALAFYAAQPATIYMFLTLTTHLPDADASAYDSVWNTKSAITRVLEQRHAAARVAGTEHAALLEDLKGLRRRMDRLLQDRRLGPVERERLLAKAADDRDLLERALAKALPMRRRAAELAALGSDALVKLLPDHTVLIDIVRYTRFEYNRAQPGKLIETRTPSYAAFMVRPSRVAGPTPHPTDRNIVRIELGAASAIDGAVAYWREAIESRPAGAAAKQLHDLVWAKIAPRLPAGTKTLYIAPDGDLARVPWAALPVGQDRVLLQDYAMATVPHGPFLLEQLKYPRQFSGPESLLTVGDVDYVPGPNSTKGRGEWPPLPGTKVELAALATLAPSKGDHLSRSDATPDRLTQALPKARFAHLATHGEFQAKEFAAEQQRAEKALQTRRFGDETQRMAAKNPLGYVGLVLARGDIMSGLSILDLNLENLKLVTLSACETGLGEYTGGKGVENLQAAFHLAGCRNVVASLWKVNDAATAALMTKFYHEMWVNKKPPIEALREAQLTIYRHPELIPALAGERGRPELDKATAIKSGEPSRVSGRVADTKLWAAFVLSGVGK